MYKQLKTAVVIPAYNEERLIAETIDTIPDFIDYIIVVNDASNDKTLEVVSKLTRHNKKLTVLNNERNGGVGYSLKKGYRYALDNTDTNVIGVMSGDAQCPPDRLQPMMDELIEKNCDYVKGNRFYDRKALRSMPAYRRIGNIFISLLTKFSTGYYSISDITMGFGFFRRNILEKVDFELIKHRYEYEVSMLVALSIADARIKDFPVPAIYGEEVSSINFWPTVFRVLRVNWVGFWQRMYYKYIIFSLHPIIILLFGGVVLSVFGWIFALYLLLEKWINNSTPTSGTVMLAVLPIFLGFQMLLTALMMDMANEDRP